MMRELPVDAKAVCTDGEAGQITDVIVDPVGRKVTHVVVREKDMGYREFLVPLDRITDSSRDEVRLNFPRAELPSFTEFTITHFVSASSPEAQPVIAAQQMEMWTSQYGYEPIYMPYLAAPEGPVPITEARVPAGQLGFERGAAVQSSDNEYLGDVEAFVIQPDDGSITHFVLRGGPGTHSSEVTLPVSSVASAHNSQVQLTLSKAQFERLPSVPAGGKFRPVEGRPGTSHLVSVVFPSAATANDALRALNSSAKDGRLGRIETAVVSKTADGKLKVSEFNRLSTGRGAVAGVVTGGLLSLLGGPIGLVGGAVIGATAGGVAGHVADRAVPDRYVRDLGRALKEDSSAIVLLVEDQHEPEVQQILAPFGGYTLQLALSDEMLGRLINQ